MLLTILRIILIILAWLNIADEIPKDKSEKSLYITIIVTTVVELIDDLFRSIYRRRKNVDYNPKNYCHYSLHFTVNTIKEQI